MGRFLRLIMVAAGLLTGGFASRSLADPALWVVHSPSATVYLFGTVHVLPQGASQAWMDPAIGAALAASSELWTEADLGNLSSSVSAIRRYGLNSSQEIVSLLPASYRAAFLRQVGQGGVPETLIAHARPWLAEMLLNAAAMQHAGPMTLGVEGTLLAYARGHRMSTPSFETLDEQFAILADLPEAAQLTSLEQQIDEFDSTGQSFSQLLEAWRSGDDRRLDKLTNQDMREHNEAVWTELILRRNERFAQKIGDRLQGGGTAFVAVGAGHMCGSVGVPALLRQAGFAVTRIQ